MLKIASITLPLTDNHGGTLVFVHDWLEIKLLDTFGNYSMLPVKEVWRDLSNGKTYRDNSYRHEVVVDGGSHDEDRLLDIATELCPLAKQECIFVVMSDGECRFVTDRLAALPTPELEAVK